MQMKEVLKEFKKLNINEDFELFDIGNNSYTLASEKLQMEIMLDDKVYKDKFLYYFDEKGYVDNLSFKKLIKHVMIELNKLKIGE